MSEEQSQVLLSEIEQHLQRLKELRCQQKTIRSRFSFLVLIMLIFFGWSLYTRFQSVQPKSLARDIVKSEGLQSQLFSNLSHVSRVLLPVLKKNVMETIIKDKSLINFIQKEVNTFIDIARFNLKFQLNPLYLALVTKLKRHIYLTFPEFQEHDKVERAIENLINISGPRLQSILQNEFEEHIKSFLKIFLMASELKDPQFENMPDYEEAVLGITLQIFGEILREQGEGPKEVSHE